jgi:hypothetical protein
MAPESFWMIAESWLVAEAADRGAGIILSAIDPDQ